MIDATRARDALLALLLCLLLAIPFALLLLILLVIQGRPLFYGSERMKTPQTPFTLWKLRSMAVVPEAENAGVSGGDKAQRITPIGQWLRRLRLDEIPQLWNVLRGDMGFVGPRPPLRSYTERFPELYQRVLAAPPGITGLASLRFHAREEALLAPCRSPAETDEVYTRRCLPRKARLDLIWLRHRSFCFDARLMLSTAAVIFQRRRAKPIKRRLREGI